MTTTAKVTLTAENRLAAGLRAAQGDLQRFSSGAQRLLKGAFVGISIASVAQAIRATTEYGDEIQKAAARAGTSASEFQKLAAAGRQVDVDISDLSKGFKELQTSLSKAASGSESEARLFEALGLSVANLKNLKPEDQFAVIAEQLAKIEDPADRVRVGTDLLGKSYLNLVPILEQGAGGIRDLIAEQERLGNILSDEQIANLAKADDSIKRLTGSLSGLARTLVAEIAPSLAQFADNLTALITGDKVGKLNEQIDFLQRMQGKSFVTAGYGELGTGFYTPTEGAKKLRELEAKRAQILRDQDAARVAAQIEAQALAGAGNVDLSRLGAASKTGSSAARRPSGPDLEVRTQAQRSTTSPMDELLRQFDESTRTQAERIGANFEEFKAKLDELFAQGAIGAEQYNARIAEQIDADLSEVSTTAERITLEVEDTFNQMSVFAEQAGRNMQDAFAQFLFDPFKGGLQGMLASFEQTIRQMVAQAIAADLFKRLGNWAAGAAGGGGIMGAIGSVVKVMLPGKAAGGPVSGGSPYMVGEQGPELFVPRMSGSIIPNMALAAATPRAMTVVNNFSIAAPSGSIDRRTQMQLAAQVRRSVERGGRNA